MVISVNEIIDNSLNYNNCYINEQDMFYEVQCILNEGAPVDTAKKKNWIIRLFNAIKKVFTDMIENIKKFIEKMKHRKSYTPDPEFEKHPVTSEEINNLDKEPDVEDDKSEEQEKLDNEDAAKHEKNEGSKSEKAEPVNTTNVVKPKSEKQKYDDLSLIRDYVQYNHIFDADKIDLSRIYNTIDAAEKILEEAKKINSNESMEKFIKEFEDKIYDDIADDALSFRDWAKICGDSNLSSKDGFQSALKKFFIKDKKDIKISVEVYAHSKKIMKLKEARYTDDSMSYSGLHFNSYAKLSNDIKLIEDIEKSLLSSVDSYNEKEFNTTLELIKTLLISIKRIQNNIFTFSRYGYTCEEEAEHQSELVIWRVESKVKKYRERMNKSSMQESSIYSNLKLI